MHATHSDEKGLENLIFELYQDTAAQKRHQASPQFQKYATFAKNAIVNRKVVDLIPELLLEKFDFLGKGTPDKITVKIGKVTIRKSKCRSL